MAPVPILEAPRCVLQSMLIFLLPHLPFAFCRLANFVSIIIIIFNTVQDTFSVYCVPGTTPVPQHPMNAMVMVMVKLILNATSPECYISLPLTPSSSPLPPYVFPSPLIISPPPIMSSSSMLHLGHGGSMDHDGSMPIPQQSVPHEHSE